MISAILVTGRNGFIGQELVKILKKEHKIVSIIRQAKENIDYTGEELIVSDIQKVKTEDIEKFQVNLILHLAAKIRGKARAIKKNNIRSSKNIFHIAKSLKIPVVFLSSTNVLFQNMLGSYAHSKKICEELLIETNLDYLIVRVPLVIGKNSSSMQSIKNFYEKYSFFPLFGRSDGKVQPVHISSLNKILLSKINEGTFSNEILNVVGKETYTYRQIIEKVINSKNRVHFLNVPFSLSLLVARFIEKINAPFFVSSEEIISVNMDKNITYAEHSQILFLDNNNELLFAL